MSRSRRRFLTQLSTLVGAALMPVATLAAIPTPRQPAGPFYPTEPPLDDDNDLVHVAGRSEPAEGVVSDLTGRLLDRNGRPLSGARVEIWQCDANGRYRHPRDRGGAAPDPGFQGFGHSLTDSDGRYRFLTIRPVPYPGRAPHIHVAVRTFDSEPFVTQLYVAGDARNDADFLYRRIPVERRGLVTARFAPGADADSALRAEWDIVLGQSTA